MSESSVLTYIWVLWGAATCVFLIIMGWRSLVGFRQEDVVILDPAEAGRVTEQQAIIARVERLGLWAKRFGFTSIALLILVGGILGYRLVATFANS